MNADEYRAMFGLRQSTGLIGPTLRARRYAQAMADTERIAKLVAASIAVAAATTPEQRSFMFKGRKNRLETNLDPAIHATRSKIAKQNWQTLKAKRAAGLLPPARMSHMQTPEAKAKAAERSAASNRKRMADPVQRAAIIANMKAARNGTVEVACTVCGRMVERQRNVMRSQKTTTCSPECLKIQQSRATTGQVRNRKGNLAALHSAKAEENRKRANEAKKGKPLKNDWNERQMATRITLQCQRCGNEFVVPHAQGTKRKYCSRACSDAMLTERLSGKDNPAKNPEVAARISATKRKARHDS